MIKLIYNISLFFFSIIDIYVFYAILCNKVTYRFSRRHLPLSALISYVVLMTVSCASEVAPQLPLKLPLYVLFFLFLFIFFKGNAYKKIFWMVVTFFALMLCEFISLFIALLLTGTNFSDILSSPRAQLIGTVISRILFLFYLRIILRTKKTISSGFFKDFFLIILIDVFYAIIIISLFYFDTVFLTIDAAITLSFSAIIIISVLALYLLYKITKKSEEIMTTNLRMQQIEMEHKQNQDMAIVAEDLRALRHDMNNHMGVLQGLLSMHEYEDAKDYLSTITRELSVANSFVFSDNKVLSVLINNKISKARQLGITFEPEIFVSSTPFTDSDLCALLGNILENAIEASSHHENPYISFSMKKEKQTLLIQCDNTFTVAPVFENGSLVTTKENKSYHGIGTKTMRSIVDSYHGSLEFTVDDLFHVNISIPL